MKQPIGVGGIAGGDKFLVNGIFFKVKKEKISSKKRKRSVKSVSIFFLMIFFLSFFKKTQFAKDVKLGERWLYGGDVKADQNSAKAAGHELVKKRKEEEKKRKMGV